MTHDELLAKITDRLNECTTHDYAPANLAIALRKVVELHKPDGGLCNHCEEGFIMGSLPVVYPCPTIQAIEEQLQ